MDNHVPGLPGIGSDKTATPRRISVGGVETLFPGGKIIDGTLSRDPLQSTVDVDVLRAGMVMGKITATGKFRPAIIGLSNLAYADNDLTIQVSLATATEVARLKAVGGGGNISLLFIGPPSASGVVAVTAVTCTGVTLNGATSTLTTADLNLNKVSGSIIAAADGSAYPAAILGAPFGIKVTDEDGTSIDVPFPKPVIGGVIDTNSILNYPADTSTIAWLKAQLRTYGIGYAFSDDF